MVLSFMLRNLRNLSNIATLGTGQDRLLFTSEQINQIRLHLAKASLTTGLIPAPTSECLILDADIHSKRPIFFKKDQDLKKCVKVCEFASANSNFCLCEI